MTSTFEKLPLMTEFILGDKTFESTGVSELVVTRDGKKMILPVPIRSINIPEAEKIYQALKPPDLVTVADTGLAPGEAGEREIEDGVKDAMTKKLARHYDEVNWATVLAGLAVTFRDEAGQVIEDPAIIRQALLDAGLTRGHLVQIVTNIINLTQRAEEQAHFLSGNGSDSPEPCSKKSNPATQKTAEPA